MKKLSQLQSRIEEAKREMIQIGQAELLSAAKDVFTNYPDLAMITWSQYTPGFNDGDVCTHSMGDVWGLTKQDLENYDKEIGGNPEGYSVEDFASYYRWNSNTPDDIKDLFKALDDAADVWECIWGTNMTIRLLPDGIETEEYYCGY